MGEALVGGLVAAGWARLDQIAIVETSPARRDELARLFPAATIRSDVVAGADAIVAVKPDTVAPVCQALAAGKTKRVLSIAAGIRIARLEANLAPGAVVVRAMPNTPALVGVGAAAIAANAHASAADLDWARSILQSVGEVHVVDEALLDAVTGLSGSGPAYVFLFAEALIDAGIAAGLPREISIALTEQTLLGASALLKQSNDPPEVLRRNVTSPGGTTAAGLAEFDAADFRALVARVVAAATRRSVELSDA